MRAPLYLISEDDGIPLPNSKFVLDIPVDKVGLFRPQMVSINPMEPPIEKVIIGITMHGDPFWLLQNLRELPENIYEIGVLCNVLETVETDGFLVVELEVTNRVYIDSISQGMNPEDYDTVWVDLHFVPETFLPHEEEILAQIKRMINLVVDNSGLFDTELVTKVKSSKSLTMQMDILANNQIREEETRVEYLQETDNLNRFNLLSKCFAKYVENTTTSTPSKKKAKRSRALISKENTSTESPVGKPLTLEEKYEQADLPEKVRTSLEREFQKLKTTNKNSTEYSMSYDYLVWALDLPWNQTAHKQLELKDLVKVLNETHHGLEDVKEHLLEHMTIEQIRGGSTGSILCFLGPPGTGKTSIAKQIAEASGRPLVRVALGGMGDEAELRGHRRTYIASRPGRIIVGLKEAGVMDPVILLDEVDKIPKHLRGDPTAALLEILDPEQNDHFVDRYLEFPIDLSGAIFICTANYKEQIPEALADRMEFVQFREYTFEERQIILRNYLLPKAYSLYSLDDWKITFSDDVLDALAQITQVRKIEQKIKHLLRKAAVQIHVYDKEEVEISSDFADSIIAITKKKKPVGFN